MTSEPKHTNRLIKATSPYLLQHAHNPVDWYEWGPEAFEKATTEDKPVFLSIGYAACHWCHVMEHESFEDEEVANYLNEHYVSIKVDREERPDLDDIYMQVTMWMNNGHGGWPMSVFLTPERVPFMAGTYYPKQSFMVLIERLNDYWENKRDDINKQSEAIRNALREWAAVGTQSDVAIPEHTIMFLANGLAGGFDPVHGGTRSEGNKFPPSMAIDLILRRYHRKPVDDYLTVVDVTLEKMANGGIYDHLGGGIARYSTDPIWHVPHFEKMLYDQALVSRAYLDGYLVTDRKRYADVARDIFRYVLTDLQSPEGGFYSTRDADSEGLEGKYYLWTVEQVEEVLGKDEATIFNDFYNVTPEGNWKATSGRVPPGPKNILRIIHPPSEVAARQDLSESELHAKLEPMRVKLLEARNKRTPPLLDDKILTAWNGLMISSLAKGTQALGDPQYAAAASRAAGFILTKLKKDGRLYRSYRNGEIRHAGFLEDYAFLIEGLIDLYEATFDIRWLNEARALNEVLVKHYLDKEHGAFFFTADDAETTLVRNKAGFDSATPSGNSVQAMNLLRLAKFFDRKDYREMAEGIFRLYAEEVDKRGQAYERLISALDFYYDSTREIVIIGDPGKPETKNLLDEVFARYMPNKIVVLAKGNEQAAAMSENMPLMNGKTMIDSKPTVYVCENYACLKPAATTVELVRQLDAKAPYPDNDATE
jgi:uncharacterized protein YyaL (SSP411 family)